MRTKNLTRDEVIDRFLNKDIGSSRNELVSSNTCLTYNSMLIAKWLYDETILTMAFANDLNVSASATTKKYIHQLYRQARERGIKVKRIIPISTGRWYEAGILVRQDFEIYELPSFDELVWRHRYDDCYMMETWAWKRGMALFEQYEYLGAIDFEVKYIGAYWYIDVIFSPKKL